ncbi:MAG: hypothetical protein JST89_03465 [Cyanobacteria bacterium SZAS-4]|nr:hypothetical protein [Cyanobacteria bacterium SZAS-4]
MSLRTLSVLMLASVWCISTPAGNSQVSKSDLAIRHDDAIQLTKQAHKLSKQVKTLTRLTEKTIAVQSSQARHVLCENLAENKTKYDLEVHESMEHTNPERPRRVVAAESQPVLRNYADLVARYHAALSAYLQHRQSVQQHAAAFHAAAEQQNSQSQSNNQPMVIAVPPVGSLQLQTQDACDALQQAEANLHSLEEELSQAIAMMMNNRKSLSAAQYGALWTQSEQRVNALQVGANAFDQNVVAKQGVIQANMHGKMQEAMRDGDYVLSQKVYGDQQRSSWVLHEEVQRAAKHSQLAMQLLNQLQSLSPYASNRPSGNSASTSDPNQFIQDDQELATEYAQVQSLYQQVQEASPKFHQ